MSIYTYCCIRRIGRAVRCSTTFYFIFFFFSFSSSYIFFYISCFPSFFFCNRLRAPPPRPSFTGTTTRKKTFTFSDMEINQPKRLVYSIDFLFYSFLFFLNDYRKIFRGSELKSAALILPFPYINYYYKRQKKQKKNQTYYIERYIPENL